MDGSTASLIAIPIVTTLRALAAWLLLVAYAAARPQWKHGTAAAGPRTPPQPAIRPVSPNAALPTWPWPTLARTPSRKSPPS